MTASPEASRWRIAEPEPAARLTRLPYYEWLIVGVTCIGAFIGQVDGSIVQLALPALTQVFDRSVDDVRWVAITHLGRFFTVNVAIAEDHKLITTGPYRYVRHPSYTGLSLIFLGFGLCMLNILSLAAVFLPISVAFIWRMHVEEAALREVFGESYHTYATRTRRIIPFVY